MRNKVVKILVEAGKIYFSTEEGHLDLNIGMENVICSLIKNKVEINAAMYLSLPPFNVIYINY